MIKVQRFINQLMNSNCYVVYNEDTKQCLVIDPASEKSLEEIKFIEEHNFILDYIIITHEHTDHNWGVNSLRERFSTAKLICSEACNKYVKKTSRAYFLFYYDDPHYIYEIDPADILVRNNEEKITWGKSQIQFILTPGHSPGSMCINIAGMLFTGDTIMPFKPYFNGRDSNVTEWCVSVNYIKSHINEDTLLYPGHGDLLMLKNYNDSFDK